MKINNKPMSALPSVADTPADTGRSCVRLFGLYTILPKVLRVVVEVLFLYHLITGFYHLEPFLRFGKHVRETASFQQEGPPLTEWPSIIVELRGLPPYVGLPPFFRCVVTLGTNSGTLRGFFLASFQRCRTYTKGRILSIYQENARRPQERRALSVANNR